MTLSYPVAQRTLGNGLRALVSEDHGSPAATVLLAYDVGSRDDPPGRTGLARLVQQLMLPGSRSIIPGEHAAPMNACGEQAGAAATADLTLCWQHVPAGAADLALWLEAGRMAALAEGLTPERLDAARRVITREQNDDLAAGSTGTLTGALVYPPGHPYRHPAAGYPDDLNAATPRDVAAFFRDFCSPRNAVLAVVGDVTAGQVLDHAERYFGDIPAGPRSPHVHVPVLKAAAAQTRRPAAGRVPLETTVLGFRLPPACVTDPDIVACDLALRVLADGTASRAHRNLVQHAQQVTAQTHLRTAGNSLGTVTVQAVPGVPGGLIEKVLAFDLEQLAACGPGEEELACARAAAEHQLLGRLSACAGRAAALAGCAIAFGDPALVNILPGLIADVTPAQVRDAAGRWLRPGSAAVLTVSPAWAAAGLFPRERTR